jgi:hypothetical protein
MNYIRELLYKCEKRKIIHNHVRPKRKNIQFNDIWNKLRNPIDHEVKKDGNIWMQN